MFGTQEFNTHEMVMILQVHLEILQFGLGRPYSFLGFHDNLRKELQLMFFPDEVNVYHFSS